MRGAGLILLLRDGTCPFHLCSFVDWWGTVLEGVAVRLPPHFASPHPHCSLAIEPNELARGGVHFITTSNFTRRASAS